jgi:NADH-quinone oxidoreductase subunit E
VLAGFPDGRVDEGPAAGEPSLVGLKIARERGWTAPDTDDSGAAASAPAEADDRVAEQAAVEESNDSTETAAEKEEGK